MQDFLRQVDPVVALTVISCCGYMTIGALVPRSCRLDPFCMFCLAIAWGGIGFAIDVGESLAGASTNNSPAARAANVFAIGVSASIASLIAGRLLAAWFRNRSRSQSR